MPMTVVVYYAISNFGCLKNVYVVHGVLHAARNIASMQQVALAACIILKCLHATVEHFECCPKQRHAVRSIAHATIGICFDNIFL